MNFTKIDSHLALMQRKNLFFFLKKSFGMAAGITLANITTVLLQIKKSRNYLFQIGLSINKGITTPITKADITNVKSRLLKRKSV